MGDWDEEQLLKAEAEKHRLKSKELLLKAEELKHLPPDEIIPYIPE